MKSKIKNILSKLTPWANDSDFQIEENKNRDYGKFELLFNKRIIGTLEYLNSKWVYTYSDEFKKEQFVLPLIDFPDVNKAYEFTELMPFFASRIPNLNQPFHDKKIRKYNANKKDVISLLMIFGHKSINNPFDLRFIGRN